MSNPDIILNGEKINYTLEDENTIGDVVKSLSSWLGESGMLIDSLHIDEKSRSLTDNLWKDQQVDSIQTLRLHVVSLRESKMAQLEVIKNYYTLIREAIKNNDSEIMKELAKDYRDVRRLLPSILEHGIQSIQCPTVDAIFSKNGLPGDNINQLMEEISAILDLLETRYEEIAQPEKQAKVIAGTLAHLAEELDKVAIYLQTGKDTIAMTTIIQLTIQLQAFLRCMTWMDNSESVSKLNKEMKENLTELEDALKTHDTVLIGDLLEYEIKPRLIDLPKMLAPLGEATS